ncbi:hypothetical protein IQ62_33565 [Streptomyces scabiei]|nr:hypothetical protein IQ62_33565 [Streptomyces scabiei]
MPACGPIARPERKNGWTPGDQTGHSVPREAIHHLRPPQEHCPLTLPRRTTSFELAGIHTHKEDIDVDSITQTKEELER